MKSMEKIRIAFPKSVCRECINKKIDVFLLPKDCVYEPEKTQCFYCKRERGIVCGLRLSGKRKMFFHKG